MPPPEKNIYEPLLWNLKKKKKVIVIISHKRIKDNEITNKLYKLYKNHTQIHYFCENNT